MENGYERRGYLLEDFRLFHLKDRQLAPIDFHYHTFHKIIVFLGGKGCYAIEGRRYALSAGDLLFVPQGCIHRPEIAAEQEYERIVLYIRPGYLRELGGDTCDLETCFERSRETLQFVAHPQIQKSNIYRLLRELEHAPENEGFGSELLTKSLFLRLMIELTRAMLADAMTYIPSGSDPQVDEMVRFLNEHLTLEVRVDDLAQHLHLSKYYLMRRFKETTGYTVHQYLLSKRLMLAREMIGTGASAMQACYSCGFGEYSAFSRAYRKQFGASPRKHR